MAGRGAGAPSLDTVGQAVRGLEQCVVAAADGKIGEAPTPPDDGERGQWMAEAQAMSAAPGGAWSQASCSLVYCDLQGLPPMVKRGLDDIAPDQAAGSPGDAVGGEAALADQLAGERVAQQFKGERATGVGVVVAVPRRQQADEPLLTPGRHRRHPAQQLLALRGALLPVDVALDIDCSRPRGVLGGRQQMVEPAPAIGAGELVADEDAAFGGALVG